MSIVLLMPLVSASVAWPSAAGVRIPDFAAAKAIINRDKRNLNYAKLCQGRLEEGQMKKVCHLKDVPSVAFLFCKYQLHCEYYIKMEVNNIKQLITGGVRTVEIDTQWIEDVKCGSEVDLTCTGFLEGWVGGGWLQRLDTLFSGGKDPVKQLIKTIREKIPTSQGLKETAEDLIKVKAFMFAGKDINLICDLQGFFLTAGGFLVSDPEDIKKVDNPKESCPAHDPGTKLPTAQQVREGLDLLIQDLSKG